MMSLLTRDVSCQQAVELVTDYLEGKLSRRNRRRLEAHLRGCAHCSEYLEQIRTTIRIAGRVEPDSLDAATRAGLIDLYRQYRSEESDES